MLTVPHRPRLHAVVTASLAVLTLALAGCETTQGTVPGATQPVPAVGTNAANTAREIEPAPESKSFPTKKDVFQGAEYDSGVANLPAGAKQVSLRVGEIREVYRGVAVLGDGQYEMAFYLPPEARSVVQLVVESKGVTRTYFLRAIGVGDTVGGAVERRWLDRAGYNVADAASEARVQAAIRANPILISVRP